MFCVELDVLSEESRHEVVAVIVAFLPAPLHITEMTTLAKCVDKLLRLKPLHILVVCAEVDKTIRHFLTGSHSVARVVLLCLLDIASKVVGDHQSGKAAFLACWVCDWSES